LRWWGRALDLRAYGNQVQLDFNRPGKPTDNAFIEAFNARLHAECLNEHWFLSLDDTREKIGAWRQDYNHHRPHSALGNATPAQFARRPRAGGIPPSKEHPNTNP
jgi:putative transposase